MYALIVLGSGLAERFVPDHFENDGIAIMTAVVEPKLTLLELQIEGLGRHFMELRKSLFGEGAEGLDAVGVASATGKFNLPVLDKEVLLITQVDKAVISSPAVGADETRTRGLRRDSELSVKNSSTPNVRVRDPRLGGMFNGTCELQCGWYNLIRQGAEMIQGLPILAHIKNVD